MCGICGTIGTSNNELVQDMLGAISHRGPDHSGIYSIPDQLTIGNNRLSIIDLEGGDQPVFNENKTIVVVYNGEIYNFKEIRDKLVKSGHNFTTNVDTEVIVHAYEEYGVDCLKHFNGMFAFCLWDSVKQQTFIARDRMGIKPLYYINTEKSFTFFSELKALKKHKDFTRRPNTEAMIEYLMMGYVRAPNTLIKGVRKLPPGHFILLRNRDVNIHQYWKPGIDQKNPDYNDCIKGIKEGLRKSVDHRLMADVPVGVLLSGGIDSSAITAFASNMGQKEVETYAIGFTGEKDNEFDYAEQISKQFNTTHHKISIDSQDIDLLPKLVWINDEPVVGPSSIAYHIMFEKIKSKTKVVLLGHGADEIFGGYEQLKLWSISRFILNNKLLRPLASFFTSAITKLFNKDTAFQRLNNFVRHSDNQPVSYLNLISIMDSSEIDSITQISLDKIESIRDELASCFPENQPSFLDSASQFEMNGWLTDNIVHRVDRVSMASSIEARVPFLDHNLVEFANNIPFNLKLKGRQEKYILKQAMKGLLPETIISRKKQRFNTPIDHFFKGKLDSICKKVFSEDNFLNKEVFNKDALLNLLNFKQKASFRFILRHNKLFAQFYSRQIWSILVLHIWYKIFIEDTDYDKIDLGLN